MAEATKLSGSWMGYYKCWESNCGATRVSRRFGHQSYHWLRRKVFSLLEEEMYVYCELHLDNSISNAWSEGNGAVSKPEWIYQAQGQPNLLRKLGKICWTCKSYSFISSISSDHSVDLFHCYHIYFQKEPPYCWHISNWKWMLH